LHKHILGIDLIKPKKDEFDRRYNAKPVGGSMINWGKQMRAEKFDSNTKSTFAQGLEELNPRLNNINSTGKVFERFRQYYASDAGGR